MKQISNIKNAIYCLRKTTENAHQGMKNISDSRREYVKKSIAFLYQTYVRDLPYLCLLEILHILNTQLGNNEIVSIQHATQQKIVVLIPGFCSNCSALKRLKDELDKTDINYISINERVDFFNIEVKKRQVVREILKILDEAKTMQKQLTLFGYSYGGAIGSHFAKKRDIGLVTYGTPERPENTPFAVSGTYYGMKIPQNTSIQNHLGVHIVEEFSFANPQQAPETEKIVIQGQMSHFSINHPHVVKTIIENIHGSFKK